MLGSWAPTAHACSCPESVAPRVFTPIWRDTDTRLIRESIELDCKQTSGRKLRCTWHSTHVYARAPERELARGLVRPPSAGMFEVLAATVSVDGVALELRAFEARDCWAHTGDQGQPLCARNGVPEREHYELAAAGVDGEVSVEITTEFELELVGWCPCLIDSPRHIVLGTGDERVGVNLVRPRAGLDELELEHIPASVATSVEISAPPRWDIHAGPLESRRPRLRAAHDERPLGGVWLSRETHIHGPLLGAGVGFGDRGFGVRPQLRAGWELLAKWVRVGGSLAAETDAREQLVLAPLFEGYSPVFGPLPSVGGGLGVPVMILPEVRPGFRVQLTLSWPVVSVVGNFDVYPGGSGWTQALRGTVLVQLSI